MLKMQAQTEPRPPPPFQKEKRSSLCEETKSGYVSLVWPCWVLVFGVMWCCAVMFPEEGLDLLTASLQTEGGRHLLQQFHHSPLNLSHHILNRFPLLGKQLSASGSIPGLIKLKCPSVGWLVVWLVFPSFLK